MNESERAWLACAIDSEGSIVKGKDRLLRIVVYNTNRTFLEKVLLIANAGTIATCKNSKRHFGRKLLFRFHISGTKAFQVLSVVEPFLIIKRDRASEILNEAVLSV